MSGETLFKRKCKLTIAPPLATNYSDLGPREITIGDGLRVTFKIEKTPSKDSNSAHIQIYNLAAATRDSFGSNGAKVILEAGYVDTMAQIFIGDALFTESKRDGANWITTIEACDGARAAKFARVSESFKGGTTTATVAIKLARACGLPLGNMDQVVDGLGGQFVHGYSAHGVAYKELDKILNAQGYELSIQDGALHALKVAEVSTAAVIVLNSNSGLLGSPSVLTGPRRNGPAGFKAKSLLQPSLKIGRRVRVESIQHNGDFKIVKINHSGDTDGADWFTELELKAL